MLGLSADSQMAGYDEDEYGGGGGNFSSVDNDPLNEGQWGKC